MGTEYDQFFLTSILANGSSWVHAEADVPLRSEEDHFSNHAYSRLCCVLAADLAHFSQHNVQFPQTTGYYCLEKRWQHRTANLSPRGRIKYQLLLYEALKTIEPAQPIVLSTATGPEQHFASFFVSFVPRNRC